MRQNSYEMKFQLAHELATATEADGLCWRRWRLRKRDPLTVPCGQEAKHAYCDEKLKTVHLDMT
jgi:hypothetical protein